MAYNNWKVGLLPEDRHVSDTKWIAEQLGYLNDIDREKVCDAYSKVFREAEAEKEGSGRFTANTRLRLFIKKRFAVFNG